MLLLLMFAHSLIWLANLGQKRRHEAKHVSWYYSDVRWNPRTGQPSHHPLDDEISLLPILLYLLSNLAPLNTALQSVGIMDQKSDLWNDFCDVHGGCPVSDQCGLCSHFTPAGFGWKMQDFIREAISNDLFLLCRIIALIKVRMFPNRK